MNNDPVGCTIIDTRPMTDEEMEREGWGHARSAPPVLVLDNGQLLFPSQDPEGNGPGDLFGFDGDSGDGFWVRPNTE